MMRIHRRAQRSRRSLGPWFHVLWLPFLLASCGSAFRGPVIGSIIVERPADAADAITYLLCRGGGLHGEIQTDRETARVAPGGQFAFLGSLTFPTTERCYIEVRHPRYRTTRVELDGNLVEKLAPIPLESWEAIFAREPEYRVNPSTHRPWPESEVRRHLLDTETWLRSFSQTEQRQMARYIPDLHTIYGHARSALGAGSDALQHMQRQIGRIEEKTAYPFAFAAYLEAIKSGDASRVDTFLAGGVLRDIDYGGNGSALYLAAAGGHLAVIESLLDSGEPINLPGCAAPLLGAIAAKKWDAARYLVRTGADTEPECGGRRPLGDALSGFARGDRSALLRDFLEAGVPADTGNSRGKTALVEAAGGGHVQAVQLLLAWGADPGVRTGSREALVDAAAREGYLDVEQALRRALDGDLPERSALEVDGESFPLPWRRAHVANFRVYSDISPINAALADPLLAGVLWLATDGGLARLEPRSGSVRVWSRADGLPSSRVETLWFDTDGDYLWLGTAAGLARFTLDGERRLETIGTGNPRATRGSRFLHRSSDGAVWFLSREGLYELHVESSFARRFDIAATPAASHQPAERQKVGIEDAGGASWRLVDDRWQRRTADGHIETFRHVPGPLGSNRLTALCVAHSRLFVGVENAPLAVLDLRERQWARIEGITDIRRLRRVAGRPEILAIGRSSYHWLDPGVLSAAPPGAGGIPVAPWQDIRDLEFDGTTLWVLRDGRYRRGTGEGVHRVSQDGSTHIEAAGHYRLGELTGVVQDPGVPGRLWLRRRGSSMPIDFDKGTTASALIRTRGSSRQPPSLQTALKFPRVRALTTGPGESPDPEHGELVWGVSSTGPYLRDGPQVIKRWQGPLPAGAVAVTRAARTTVWIASDEGLIEYPIPDDAAPPKQPGLDGARRRH